MDEDCLFCKIIKGDIPSYTLYEDEDVKVFLDILPVSKGHSLFIPKKHYKFISDVPETEMSFLQKLPKVVEELKKTTGATGMNVYQNNGKDAGQIIGHIHFHLIPRFPDDGVIQVPTQSELDERAAQELVEKFSL